MGFFSKSAFASFMAAAFFASASSFAAPCELKTSDTTPNGPMNFDALYQILTLSPHCPKDVFELRDALSGAGGRLLTTMVGNRGFHNPGAGSFSFFEMVEGLPLPLGGATAHGDFFFGHFTQPSEDGRRIEADQTPSEGRLMIEVVVWDPLKRLYNFYELIGDGTKGVWHYRGDSADIVADVQWLHRERPEGTHAFGNNLRCSGCHVNGGPVMKELDAPHNDWWTRNRPLPMAGRTFDERLRGIAANLVEPGELASAVREGNRRLQGSATLQQALIRRGLKVLLRPLFAPQEVNFASDPEGEVERRSPMIHIPGASFIDPMLFEADGVVASRLYYERLLVKYDMRFPETSRRDGDHAWLTPVKAAADSEAIRALVESRIIDSRFVRAVLAIDFTNPVFSPVRARLLELLPEHMTPHWKDEFIVRLRQSELTGARELAENLTREDRDERHFRPIFERYLRGVRTRALTERGLEDYFRILIQRRREIAASEISTNPRGQILEPGFRVIFPETTSDKAPAPGELILNAEGYVMAAAGKCPAHLR